MTLKQMQTFAAVCREGSVTAAAGKLFLAQSAVSRTLREIAEEYGIVLFDHIGGRLRPTSAAVQLLNDVNEILDLSESMESRLRSGSYAPSLRIGCSMAVGAAILPKAIAEFEKAHPEVKLQIEENNAAKTEQRVLMGEADFAIIAGSIHDERLTQEVFTQEHMCWACHVGHPILSEGEVSISRLAEERLYLPGEDIGGRDMLDGYAMAEGVKLEPVWSTVNVAAQMDAVLHGRGISLLSEKAVQSHVLSGELAIIPTNMRIFRKLGAIYLRRKRLSGEAREFIDLCSRIAKEL